MVGVALALASKVLSQRRRLRHLAAEHRLQRRYLRLHLYWQSTHLTQVRSGVNIGSAMLQSKKGKVFPYSLPSVGPGADPGVQAVSPQVA